MTRLTLSIPMRFLLFTALFFAASSVWAQDAEADFTVAADVFFAEASDRFGDMVPGFAVAVVRGDETVYARGFGYADREAGLEATADTPFYIASVTKPFTSVLAVLLAREGVLSLDNTLADLFPDIAFDPAIRPDEVTVRHLLSHTSGLESEVILVRTGVLGTPSPRIMRHLLAGITANADAPFGSYAYTNLGPIILSLWLDGLGQGRWQDLLAERVYQPAGMTRTTSYESEVVGEPAPYVIHPERGAERIAFRKYDDTMHAAGGTFASARDLARWLRIHLNEGWIDGQQVFAADVIAEVHRPNIEGRGERFGPFGRDGYALGWQTGTYDGDPMLHHFGSYAGALGHTSFMPTRDMGVVVLTNESFASTRYTSMLAQFAYDWWAADTTERDSTAADARAAIASAREQFGRVLERMAGEQVEAEWQLSLPASSYIGVYVNEDYGKMMIEPPGDLSDQSRMDVRLGRLHSAAVPSPDADAIRADLYPQPGQLDTLQFILDGDEVVGLDWEGTVFERAGT